MNPNKKNSIALSLLLLCSSQSWAQVTVFKDKNFSGPSKIITKEGEHSLTQSIGDKVLSSVKVAPGWKVTLYDGYGDDPDTRKLTSDVKDLGDYDNRASLLIIERVAGSAGTSKAPAGTAHSANNKLNAGEPFPAAGEGNNHRLVSANGAYMLVPGTQGNSGMFCTFKSDVANPFAAGLQNAVACIGKPNYPNAKIVLQTDGDLVILSNTQGQQPHIIWASSTVPAGDPRFNDSSLKPVSVGVGNDGGIELYNAKEEKVWYDNAK